MGECAGPSWPRRAGLARLALAMLSLLAGFGGGTLVFLRAAPRGVADLTQGPREGSPEELGKTDSADGTASHTLLVPGSTLLRLPEVPGTWDPRQDPLADLRDRVRAHRDVAGVPTALAAICAGIARGEADLRRRLQAIVGDEAEDDSLRGLAAIVLALTADRGVVGWAETTLGTPRNRSEALLVAAGLTLAIRPQVGSPDVPTIQELLLSVPVGYWVYPDYLYEFRLRDNQERYDLDRADAPVVMKVSVIPSARFQALLERVSEAAGRSALCLAMRECASEGVARELLDILVGPGVPHLKACEAAVLGDIARARRADDPFWREAMGSLSFASYDAPAGRQEALRVLLGELATARDSAVQDFLVQCLSMGGWKTELIRLLDAAAPAIPARTLLTEIVRGDSRAGLLALERAIAGDWGGSMAHEAIVLAATRGIGATRERALVEVRSWLSDRDPERRLAALEVLALLRDEQEAAKIEAMASADPDERVRSRAREATESRRK